jgi:hypothetical protein
MWLFPTSAVLVTVCIGVLALGGKPAYGQPDKIPDLTGEWIGHVRACVFFDTYAGYPSAPQPAPDCTVEEDGTKITIAWQNGPVFAFVGENGVKATGTILPDGAWTLHTFTPRTHERMFLTGTLGVKGNSYVMTGGGPIFEDPDKISPALMGSIFFEFSKAR